LVEAATVRTTERELNGLELAKLQKIEDSLKNDPNTLKAFTGPWRTRIRWQGGFRAKAYMRNHTVEFDEPADLASTDQAASAHEHILSAIGACMMTGYVYNATKRGVKIDDLEIALEGNFDNILKWAGLSETGNPGYKEIKAKIFVKADADKKELEEIWKEAIEGSPVTQTVSRGVRIVPEFSSI
jgi:uncharacterized OsmC-like protein